jgi:hypothetical protein
MVSPLGENLHAQTVSLCPRNFSTLPHPHAAVLPSVVATAGGNQRAICREAYAVDL